MIPSFPQISRVIVFIVTLLCTWSLLSFAGQKVLVYEKKNGKVIYSGYFEPAEENGTLDEKVRLGLKKYGSSIILELSSRNYKCGELTALKKRLGKGETFDLSGSKLNKLKEIVNTAYTELLQCDSTVILNMLKRNKPVITEKDETSILFVVFGDSDSVENLFCKKKESDFTGVDARIVTPITTQTTKKKEPSALPKVVLKYFLCDLNTLGKGGKSINFTIGIPDDREGKEPWNNETDQPNFRDVVIQGSVDVHALYRFRITAGPVFSSLLKDNKSFTVIANSGGGSVIQANTKNDSPVNYGIFLKFYWQPNGRDLLDLPPLSEWYYRFNPIIGVNIFDRPLNNFYVGVSFEPIQGIDIVGGAHWAKQTRLAGGFVEGEVFTGSGPPTKDRFFTGYFIGVTADVGIFGSWLGNAVISTIRGTFGSTTP